MGILLDKIKELTPKGYRSKRKSNEIIRRYWPDIVAARKCGYSAKQIVSIIKELEGHEVSEMCIFANLKREENLKKPK